MRTLITIMFAVLCLAGGVAAAQETQDGDAILVLDGSGSMWGQINGEAKITIAKSVLADLLADLPEDRRLGLMAYGHRREGDCADIEELAPVGTDRAAISKAVQGLTPRGKTPMADAIKLAAEKLNYTEKKASVILVSDGIETCEPDPCGVAAALEKAGADFTAHVIGFDVTEENDQAQLRCLAENTGGTFVSATDAGELSEALEETVAAVPDVVTVTKMNLRATELEGGLLIEDGLSWRVTDAAGEEVFAREGAGIVDFEIDPGTYDVTVERPSDGLKGSLENIAVKENTSKIVTIALTFPVEASLSADPANEGVAGTNVKITWEGPDRRGDYIAVSEKGADNGRYLSYEYTRQGSPAEVRLPLEPGEYEIRYMLGRPIRVLASIDYTVTAASATLEAPDEAVAGESITVEFTGPPAGSGDWITVVAPDAPESKYNDYAYTRSGSPAELRMPLEAGDYEIRFVQGGKKVLARRPIKVVTALATVSGPEEAIAGESITVEFTGPEAGSGDWITVAAADAPESKYNDYAYTRSGSPAELRMPLEAGDYEIRFVQGGKKVLARQPIKVVAALATISGPEEAIAGEEVSIEFTGPEAGSGDWITVVAPEDPANKYNDYAYIRGGSPATVRMPLEAGEYELRYVQGGNKVIASQPITIVTAEATLSAQDEAIAGETIEVEFTGPKPASGDWITVTAPDDPANKYTSYHYTRSGSPAKVRMPLDAGEYELRFVQASKKVLATRPITVTAATATLNGPASGVADTVVEIAFTGPPPGSGDYIVIAEPDAPVKKYLAYGYVSGGSPAKVRMPKEAGAYELRYIQGGQKILTTAPITVTAE